jgi:hypothetical protein
MHAPAPEATLKATGYREERRAAWILGAFALSEGLWCVVNFVSDPAGFLSYLGFAPGRAGTPTAWIAALLVTAAYIAKSLQLPSVREHLVRPSWLKALAIVMALVAAVLEEAFFRRMWMDYLARREIGPVVQILTSGLLFGIAHGIWGLFGRSVRAAAWPIAITGVLGTALAGVYVLGGRSLAPCIAAHFLLDVAIEPGLVLAALRGEMAVRGRRARAAPESLPVRPSKG